MVRKIIALCFASFTLVAADMQQVFEAVKKDPLQLRDFLYRMPKGADLHNHLDGAVYAENLIAQAAREKLCVDERELKFTAPNKVACDQAYAEGTDLYHRMIRALSMHDFVPGEEPADEHFFATFDKYMALKQTNGEWGHEVASRAAAQHEQYIELMLTVPCDDCKHLSEQIENKKLDELLSVKSLLTTWDFSADIAKAQQLLRDTEAKRKSLGESDIKVRYLFKAFRGLPHKTVFAQLAFAFQLLAAESKQPEPLMVGLNLVMREDGYHALKNYSDQMKVIGFLKNQYPGVRVSLHAGELTLGLVPPEDLTFHINEAVHVAKAERIGHGTDIIYEKDNEALLKYMASNHIVVEIIPSSADVILGVRGNKHPLALYLKHHVPMVISTDDEGVLRSDLTNEFQMAVEQHNLTYADLKKMVRNSLEYSFLPGDSLWIDHDYHRLHPACQQDKPASKTLSTSCQQFIKSSEKAERQWVLEREVIDFEAWARIPAPTYH